MEVMLLSMMIITSSTIDPSVFWPTWKENALERRYL